MSSYLSSGDSGLLGTEWSVQNARRNSLSRLYGTTADNKTNSTGKMDFDSSLVMMGIDDSVVLDKLEFNVLGFDKLYGGDLLSWNKSAWSESSIDDRLFQGSDYKTFTNIDFDKGTWKVLNEKTVTQDLGMDWSGGKPYDVLELKNNRVNFYDFVFAGTGDGSQKNVGFSLNELSSAKWGINKYNIREVNTALIGNGKNDYESSLTQQSIDIITSSVNSWITPEIKADLDNYEYGSKEYNQKLIEHALRVMDNEGYLKGNEIDSPATDYYNSKAVATKVADGEKSGDVYAQIAKDAATAVETNKGSSFSVVRAANGQVRMTLKNVSDYDIAGVGKVSGTGTFSIGKTDGKSNRTVIQAGQTGAASLDFDVDKLVENAEFYGKNVNVKYSDKTDRQYNVKWSAENSTFDSSKSSASVLMETDARSNNSTIKLGNAKTDQNIGGIKADNFVVDSGKGNKFISDDNTQNYFETTKDSKDAVILGGNGENTFNIGGDGAIVVGGKGKDTFTTNGDSKGNVLIGMDGDDTFTDFGKNNLLAGGKGNDKVNLNGDGALVNLGDGEDYELYLSGGAKNNAVFAGETFTPKTDAATSALKLSDVTTLNYQDFLNDYLQNHNLTMNDFMKLADLKPGASAAEIVNALKGIVK